MEYSIICGLDLGESSYSVLEHAFAEATHHPLAFLHLVTAIGANDSDTEAEAKMRSIAKEVLPTFTTKSGARKIFVHGRVGSPSDILIEVAHEQLADLIIVGRHSGSGKRAPGTTASSVIAEAPCTVQVVQAPVYERAREDQCEECVAIRRNTEGDTLFCSEHQDGRLPRLSKQVGISHYLSGWGLY